MPAVIELENVSKRFVLQHHRARSFQDALVNLIQRRNHSSEEFWALDDVSFEVRRGEMLGIIGENGSGKSTILKLMTGILEPTKGKVRVDGKVSALIELGAGFHPDLTGRENIFLNGAILGIGRKEMARRFDAIVAFSELERFIDTPVKHYSSGMYMRLGFSVAINVEPDILIIDEILAVGDEVFQRKCLDRIDDIRRKGKTIIFVSHGLPLVEQLCDRAVWLHHGILRAQGVPIRVIQSYMDELQRRDERNRLMTVPVAEESSSDKVDQWDTGAEILNVLPMTSERVEKYSFHTGETLVVGLPYRVQDLSANYRIDIELRRSDGVLIYRTTYELPGSAQNTGDGRGLAEIEFPDLPLLKGTYDVAAQICLADRAETALNTDGYLASTKSCRLSIWSDLNQEGAVVLPHRWSMTNGIESLVLK